MGFHNSIMKSDRALKPYGVSLYDILMNGDANTFDSTLNSFICIAGIQVALVDVLKSLGIEPQGIVGHSVGELACAYADGGLTAQETVLAAYMRGKCITEAQLPPGLMAAVGLTWEEAQRRCPEDVFAKEVKSAGVAFHSPFMALIAPSLKAALQKVIQEKRPRTSRWVSSSIPTKNWDSDLANFSSPEYHVNIF